MPCYADSPFRTTGLMALKASSGRRHLPKTKAQLLTLWFGRFPVSRRGCLSTACVLLTARFFCAGAHPSVAQKPYLIECSTKGAYADSGGEEAAADWRKRMKAEKTVARRQGLTTSTRLLLSLLLSPDRRAGGSLYSYELSQKGSKGRIKSVLSLTLFPQIAISKCQCVSEFRCFCWTETETTPFDWVVFHLTTHTTTFSHYYLPQVVCSRWWWLSQCRFSLFHKHNHYQLMIETLISVWVSEWNCVFQELSNVKKWASTFTKLRH